MADYKRMVSYMYLYDKGIKRKNVGYARVEERNGEGKITLHMQLPGILDSIFPTYLIQRQKGDMELIYLGDSSLKNQVMDSRMTADVLNVMGSGFGLSDMGGILLFLNEGTYFATEWDDKPVDSEEVLEALKPKTKKEEAEPVLASQVEAVALADYPVMGDTAVSDLTEEEEVFDTSVPVYKLPRGWKTLERLNSERSGMAVDPWKTVEQYRNTQMGMGQPEEQRGYPPRQGMVEEKEPEKPVAAKFFESFPRIYPFEDNEITMCVKIEPKDIGGLPVDAWVLSNNSFLLHGYYCYHHLIFAKLTDRFGTRYILGVPGIYHNRERFMARMFGFECFKSIRRREQKQGDFGYWYIPISM